MYAPASILPRSFKGRLASHTALPSTLRYVYLLHFSEPSIARRHYLGSTCDLEQRLLSIGTAMERD